MLPWCHTPDITASLNLAIVIQNQFTAWQAWVCKHAIRPVWPLSLRSRFCAFSSSELTMPISYVAIGVWTYTVRFFPMCRYVSADRSRRRMTLSVHRLGQKRFQEFRPMPFSYSGSPWKSRQAPMGLNGSVLEHPLPVGSADNATVLVPVTAGQGSDVCEGSFPSRLQSSGKALALPSC